jgi:hypothetical protein
MRGVARSLDVRAKSALAILLGLLAGAGFLALILLAGPERPGSRDARDRDDRDSPVSGVAEGRDSRPGAASTSETPAARGDLSVFGRVLRADSDAPVADARIVAFSFAGRASVEITSGPDGAFEVPGSRGGAYHLLVEKEGFARRSVEIVRPSVEPVVVRLTSGGTMEGRVLEGDKPVERYRILVVRLHVQPGETFDHNRNNRHQMLPDGIDVVRDREVEDANGRFRLESLAGGRYVLVVAAPGRQPRFYNGGGRSYHRDRGIDVEEGEVTSGVEIVLPEQGTLRFRVTDADTGERLTGVTFHTVIEVGDRKFRFPLAPIREGVAGEYEIPADIHPGWQSGQLDSLEVELSKEGSVTTTGGGGGHPSGTLHEVSLGRGARVRGRVRGRSGRPVEGSVILVRRDSDRGLYEVMVADADGRFASGPLPTGFDLELFAYDRSLDNLLAAAMFRLKSGETRSLDLGAADRAALRGIVLVHGEPAPGAFVNLDTADDRRAQLDTGADGRFRFEGVVPGRAEVMVTATMADGRMSTLERFVTIREDRPTEITVSFARTIRGLVLEDRGSWPVPLEDPVRVAARDVNRGDASPKLETRTDADGRFVLHVPGPGLYEVFHPDPGYLTPDPPRVEVAPGADAEGVRLVLLKDPEDGRILLRIVDESTGEPVAEGDFRYRHRWTSGAGMFEDGRITDEDRGVGIHRYRVDSDRHVPALVEAEITLAAKRVERTVTLRRSDCVRIVEILPESPAGAAGLRAGDLLLRHGSSRIACLPDLRAALAKSEATVEISVIRDGAETTLRIPGGRLGVHVANHRRAE